MEKVSGESQAEIKVMETEPGHYTVRVSGELDIASVEHLAGAMNALLQLQTERLELDVSELKFMDSSGIALLVQITNQFGPCAVRGASPLIRRVIVATGLGEILRLAEAP